ncbi:MAG: hypothetical protein JW958_11690 [Candidatus Eisenbacteria bacterium]|nr:hypothetical protein [Candidatus Eisenbacteria bacterium]
MTRNRMFFLAFVLFFLLLSFASLGCAGGSKERAEPVLISKEPEPAREPLLVESAPEGDAMTATGRIRLHMPKPGFRGVPGTFSWNSFPGASSYRFVLLDREQTVLFTGDAVVENLIATPPPAAAIFEPKGLYYWLILGFDEKGDKIAESPFRDFIYQP